MQAVPGAGHVVLLEQPDVGTAAITEFIGGVEADKPEAPGTLASGTCPRQASGSKGELLGGCVIDIRLSVPRRGRDR